ncbi:YhcB family protein [Marinicella gelatinilytica]|uniref:YhcB family protein n=1 Tax=Marinicella gelatinilytica TaxID=2996017 RepID=UPI0022610050|nr:DUF1043 family protein [Marinicella gelatinilytica]MCX7545217.1 DUF1043 family protein [Marinicella gelatinilytica]
MIDWILILSAGILGWALGIAGMYIINQKKGKQHSVKELEQRLDQYQQKVENHFAKTADLIDNLTDSYQAVFTHLADSAEELLTDEQIRNQLINRKSREVTIKYLKSDDDYPHNINPSVD